METLQNSHEVTREKGAVRRGLSRAAETASWLLHGMPETGRQRPQPGGGWHFPDSHTPTPHDIPALARLAKESPDGIIDVERIFTGESTD